MKLPRGVSGEELAKALEKLGYVVTRKDVAQHLSLLPDEVLWGEDD